jgi:hypothetical protein
VTKPLAALAVLAFAGCATSSQNAVATSQWPPRIKPLDQVMAAAEQYPCVQGLHDIPATVIDVGVFANVPYQSFSNGNVEVNAYGDPGDLVGLEAGTRTEDPALQQCLIQFISAQTLSPQDAARVTVMTPAPALDQQPGLSVEVTPRNGPDAYDAWWISLERPEAIAEAKAPPEQIAQVTQPQAQWAPRPQTYYRRPPRAYVRYPSYRVPGVRVYTPNFTRRRGIYIRIR